MLLILLLINTALADDCKHYAALHEVTNIIGNKEFEKNLMTAGPTCKARACVCIEGKDLRDFDIVGGAVVYNQESGDKRKASALAEIELEKLIVQEKVQRANRLEDLKEKVKFGTNTDEELKEAMRLKVLE
tara:strand:- start:3489 stop:3881 length:393 start_codon:yes stop_codon:yes gene_type:complete